MSSFALDQVTVASPSQFVASLIKSTPMPLHDTVVLAYLHSDGCQHIDTFPLGSDWVEIVEAVQNTLRVNTYEQVIICVHTDRTEDALPFTAQVKDLSAVIGSDVHVLDELLIDGNRYWSYMCDGCCDPQGNKFIVEPSSNPHVTIDFTKSVIAQGTMAKAFVKVNDNMGVNSIRAWELLQEIVDKPSKTVMAEFIALVLDVNVRDYVLIQIIQSQDVSQLVQALVTITMQTPDEHKPQLAGMAAMGLQSTFSPIMAVSEMLKFAEGNSLGRLVQTAVDHNVPQKVARDSLVAVIDEIEDKVKSALAALETQGYPEDIEPCESA